MNKKIFQSLFMIGAMLVGTAGFVGCSEDYDDDIDRLEMLIDENENAISAINQLVASGSVITGVATNAEGLEITLSNGQKYTITNGVDGMDGTDAVLWTVGQDGYWYKDGVKQDFRAIGEDGVDGQDGSDGLNGADGAPGGYYKPNADGTWDLYAADGTLVDDNTGLDWKVPLGGDEEPLTAVWNADGSLVLSGEATGNQTVIIGQAVLTDLVFIPEMTLDGHNAQEVRWLPLMDSGRCNGLPGMVAAEEVHYRINPITIDPADVEWDFVGRELETRAGATGDMAYYEPITSWETYGTGALTFLLQPGEEDSEWFSMSAYEIDRLSGGVIAKTFALKGVQDVQSGEQETQTIVSDYAVVVPKECEPVIARTDQEVAQPKGSNPNLLTRMYVYDEVPDIDAPESYIIHPGQTFDLKKFVFACAYEEMMRENGGYNFVENLAFLRSDYTLEFEKLEGYLGNDGVTDQSYFVDIDNPVNGLLTVNTNSSSLARRPVVKVTWYSNKDYGCYMERPIVKIAYIKFLITPEPEMIAPFELGQIPYCDLFMPEEWLIPERWIYSVDRNHPYSQRSYKWMCIDWQTVNDCVYEPLGISHDEFMATYWRDISPWPRDYANYRITSHMMWDGDGYDTPATNPIWFAWWAPNFFFVGPNVDTYAMCLGVNPYAKFGKYEVKVQVDPGDHHPIITFTFHYEILEPDLVVPMVPGFLLDPTADPKTIVTQGTDYGRPGNYEMQAYAGEAFNRGQSINGATSYRSFFGEDSSGNPMWVAGLCNEVEHRITLRESVPTTKYLTMFDYWNNQGNYRLAGYGPYGPPTETQNINHVFGWIDQEGIRYKISEQWKLWEDDRTYLMKFTTKYPNECTHVHNYNLMFVNPLAMTVAPILYTDHINGNKDFQDLRDNVTASINGAHMLMVNDNDHGSSPYNYYEWQPFFDYGLDVDSILYWSYSWTNSPYQHFFGPQFNSLGMYDGRFTWENDGTKLITTEKIGEMTVTFDTPFAKRVQVIDVNVEPGVAPPDTPTVPQ